MREQWIENEHVWIVTVDLNGFTVKVLVSTLEHELRGYLNSELPGWTGYIGATESEIAAARSLGLPIYMA